MNYFDFNGFVNGLCDVFLLVLVAAYLAGVTWGLCLVGGALVTAVPMFLRQARQCPWTWQFKVWDWLRSRWIVYWAKGRWDCVLVFLGLRLDPHWVLVRAIRKNYGVEAAMACMSEECVLGLKHGRSWRARKAILAATEEDGQHLWLFPAKTVAVCTRCGTVVHAGHVKETAWAVLDKMGGCSGQKGQ